MNESTLTMGSLFDGSGGFPLAAFNNGVTPIWSSEIEPFPIRVTTKRFPYMKHYGDISKIDGSKIEPVDIITFGSPCQDLSVAGKRAGMKHVCPECKNHFKITRDLLLCPHCKTPIEKTRSGLFVEAIRIIKEMREATNGQYPTFAIWENVTGAFSSHKGEDFQIVLEELCSVTDNSVSIPRCTKKWLKAGSIVGNSFSLAWRTFDAQYWGVPQRRKRIYLVADFSSNRAEEILFECDRLCGNSAESGEAWQEASTDTPKGFGEYDRESSIVYAVDQGAGKSSCSVGEGLSPTLACTHGGAPAVYYTLEPGIASREGGHIYEGISGTLRANAGDNSMSVAYAIQKAMETDEEQTTVDFGRTADRIQINAKKSVTIQADGGGLGAKTGLYLLPTLKTHCYNISKGSIYKTSKTKTIDTKGGNPACNQGGTIICEPTTLEWIVRRLIPLECSRLQGFPDWWVDGLEEENPTEEEMQFWREVFETHRKLVTKAIKPKTDKQIRKWLKNPTASDGPLYKMWGNGIALPCADAVFYGIVKAVRNSKTKA